MDQQSNSVLQNKVEQINQSIKQETPKIEQTVKNIERGGNIIWALFLIFLGVIFLCNNIGLIPWSVWSYLWRFWPILLIIGGIQAILGNSFVSRLVIGGLVVILFMGIFFTALAVSNENLLNKWGIVIPQWWKSIAQNIGQRKEMSYSINEEDYSKVGSREVTLEIGMGEFVITDEKSTDYIQIDSAYYENYGEPEINEIFDDKKLSVELKQKNQVSFGFNMSGPKYEINLGQAEIPTDFAVNLGAGSGTIDLSTLTTNAISTEVGAGSLKMTLTKSTLPKIESTIKVGTGSVHLVIPSGVAYRINYAVGLGSITINGEKVNEGISEDKTIESDNFAKATNKLEINVNVGVGSFKLDQE